MRSRIWIAILACAVVGGCVGAAGIAQAAMSSTSPTTPTPSVVAGGEQYVNNLSTEPLYAFAIEARGSSNAAQGFVFASPQKGLPVDNDNRGPVTCLEVSGSQATVTYKSPSGYRVVNVQSGTSADTAGVFFVATASVVATSVTGCYTAPYTPVPIYAGAVQVHD